MSAAEAGSCQNSVLINVEKLAELEMADFDDLYDKYDYINGGTYGKVYKCCKKGGDSKEYAVKIQEVSFSGGEHSSYVKTLNEANIWRSLNHKNVVKLYQCFLQGNEFYFVMELIPGENLFDEILQKANYTEKDACFYMKQILSALAYLHVNDIIHRDIKPDNIMLCRDGRQSATSVVKLVDFGLARRLTNGQQRMKCAPSGAPLYLAPETIMEDALGFPVDVWSCGVILYIMLYGTPPFWSEDTNKLFLDIIGAEVDYSCDVNKESASFLAKDLIQEMLVKDQNQRITASEALDHPWIVQAAKLSQTHRRSTLEHLFMFKNSNSVFDTRLKRASLSCQKRNGTL